MKLITAPTPLLASFTLKLILTPFCSLAPEVQGFQASYDARINVIEGALQAQMDRSQAEALGLGLGSGVGSDPEYWLPPCRSRRGQPCFALAALFHFCC